MQLPTLSILRFLVVDDVLTLLKQRLRPPDGKCCAWHSKNGQPESKAHLFRSVHSCMSMTQPVQPVVVESPS